MTQIYIDTLVTNVISIKSDTVESCSAYLGWCLGGNSEDIYFHLFEMIRLFTENVTRQTFMHVQICSRNNGNICVYFQTCSRNTAQLSGSTVSIFF